MKFLDLASSVFKCVAAPLYETQVKNQIQKSLQGLKHVKIREDRWGNLVCRYRYQPQGLQPIFFVGHMDHPGVEVLSQKVYLRGGVQEVYLKGAKIRFYDASGQFFLGKSQVKNIFREEEETRLEVEKLPDDAAFGVWDLPDFELHPQSVMGRACDDLVAIVSMVALVRHLSENKIPADVELWMTRAEEVGFYGTMGRIAEKPSRKNGVGISIEASRAQGYARWGKGMVLRIGDRSSLFSSSVTRWLTTHADSLSQEKRSFSYQKLWMGGGTCEGTPLHEAGYSMGAICLPLKNYHNQGSRDRLKAESVSIHDWKSMLELMLRLSTSSQTVKTIQKHFSLQLQKRSQIGLKKLNPFHGIDLKIKGDFETKNQSQ